MKNIKSLIAASAIALMATGTAHAAPLVSTTGPAVPSGATTVGGSIEKYINFTKTDTSIDLGDLGTATFGSADSPKWFQSAAPVNGAGDDQFSSGSGSQ